jgi:hypothetical protein
MIDPFKILGGAGILLISLGIINRDRKRQDTFYIAGGLCLELYSISIKDVIFIILQLIFTATAVYDLEKNSTRLRKKTEHR